MKDVSKNFHKVYTVLIVGSSFLFKKDEQWLPGKATAGQEDFGNNNKAPAQKRCCLEQSGKPLSFSQSVKAIYDTLSGRESYPCNECDKPVCQESMWHWLSSVVTDVVDATKELASKPPTATKGCGNMDAETLRDNTKGTLASFDGKLLISTFSFDYFCSNVFITTLVCCYSRGF